MVYRRHLRPYLTSFPFSSEEVFEDTVSKLEKEAVTVIQLKQLTQDECEEIGIAADAFKALLRSVEMSQVRQVDVPPSAYLNKC
jgi:uncharacterized membrane protein YcaP (DUF421 family)